MKYKFVKTQLLSVPNVIQWGWLIDTKEQLDEYLKIASQKLIDEYQKTKDIISEGDHFTSNTQYCIAYTLEPVKNRISMVDDVMILTEKFNTPKVKTFLQYGKLIVWRNLTAFAPFLGFNILNTKESEVLIFPESNHTEKDIKIIQWRGGNHWYPKLGGQDIEVNGKASFDTYDEAYNVALEYLKKGE